MKPTAPRVRLRRLEPVVRAALRAARWPRGSTVLVAVSGGADSSALLATLAALAPAHDLHLRAAHLHHGLRGREADLDLAHVRALCAALGVPLASARMDGRARLRGRGLAGEDGLRTLRREWLGRAAARVGAVAIATAHTADDQLETLLLRLGRGTGAAGAGGMRARHGRWWKPLLEATRADVEADLARARIAWRDDASNASPEYTRNRVRHGVVPALLDALGVPPGPATARRAGLARRAQALARELGESHATLERAAARAFARLTTATGLERTGLARLPLPVLRLTLRRWWRHHGPQGPAAPGLTLRHLGPWLAAVRGPRRHAEVALPSGWRALVEPTRTRLASPAGTARGAARARRHASATDARLRDRRPSPPRTPRARASRVAGPSGRHPSLAGRQARPSAQE